MSNFSYLSTRPEYSLFANSAIEAEKVFSTSPAMCAVGCRKALELAVKWVYAADKTITMPYKDNLQSLLHEPSFRFAVDRNVWSVLPSIVKAGNLAVHTGHSVSAADAVFSLRGLFDFIQWVDYCYGTDYVERSFDETAIPGEKVALDEKKIREQESLLSQKDAELEALRKQAQLYADCLEQKFGRRPMLFTTNGYTTYFWDEQSGPPRAVSGVFCKDDLQKLMNRRTEK